MLDARDDRLDYAELLAPGEGYKTDFALLTSYSLDLNALALTCMALSMNVPTNSSIKDNTACLLSSILELQDKLVVCVDRGSILPLKSEVKNGSNSRNGALALMEPIVEEIDAGEDSAGTKSGNVGNLNDYPSFHPKVWLLRYQSKKDEEEYRYRIVVTSRNMTFSTDQDIAVVLDSDKGGEGLGNELGAFLNNIAECMEGGRDISSEFESNRVKEVRELARQLAETRFSPRGNANPPEIPEIRFHYLWPEKRASFKGKDCGPFSMQNDVYSRFMAMSPFLGIDSPLRHIKIATQGDAEKPRFRIITRRDTYTQDLKDWMDEKLPPREIYGLNAFVLDGFDQAAREESEERDGDELDQSSAFPCTEIHAKLYCASFENGTDELWIGSANATYRGANVNTECLLSIRGRGIYDRLESSFFDNPLEQSDAESADGDELGDIHLFEPIKPLDLQDNGEEAEEDGGGDSELRQIAKMLHRGKLKGHIEFVGKEHYSIVLENMSALNLADGAAFSIAPITKPNYKHRYDENEIRFENLGAKDLTQWFSISLLSKGKASKIIKVEIPELINQKSDCARERNRSFYGDIRGDILQYIDMLLDESPEAAYWRSQSNPNALSWKTPGEREQQDIGKNYASGIYENLMYLLATPKGRDRITEVAKKMQLWSFGQAENHASSENHEDLDMERVLHLLKLFGKAIEPERSEER